MTDEVIIKEIIIDVSLLSNKDLNRLKDMLGVPHNSTIKKLSIDPTVTDKNGVYTFNVNTDDPSTQEELYDAGNKYISNVFVKMVMK